MENPDLEMAQKMVDLLNELIQIDRPAVAALIANRVPCNLEMANHPTVQVAAQHGGYQVGLLGLLNGFCGTYPSGFGPVVVEFDDPSEGKSWPDLLRFYVHLTDPGAKSEAKE